MRSYPLTPTVFCSLLCGALISGAGHARAADGRPNILLILSDDQSVPHVGCYGNHDIKTPHLDALAAQGMRFDRAYVASPQCVPSRAAIMTGRSPVDIKMTRFSAPLPANVITYPELLRMAGYYTGAAGRTHHMNGSPHAPEEKAFIQEHGLATFDERLDYVKTTHDRDEILDQYREFLDQVPAGKPFFLQLCTLDSHRPFDRNAIPEPHDPMKLKLPAHFPDTRLVREDFARYYDEIARFDTLFGKAMAELDKRGLADKTLVAFMGDNGAALLRGKGTLYEFGINVPLIIRWPGVVKEGSATGELISGEDLGPTFLAAAGVKVPAEMTGRSFLPLLQGRPHEERKYVFAERGAHANALPFNSGIFDESRCVVGRRYKMIYNSLWQLPYVPVDFVGDPFWKELQQMNEEGKLSPLMSRLYFSPKRPMFELYDLKNDPSEFENLIGRAETQAIEDELRTEMMKWMILDSDFLPLPSAAGREYADRLSQEWSRNGGPSAREQ